MRNQLFIWLGYTPDDLIRWLVWDKKSSACIESGVLDNAEELTKLHRRSAQNKSIVLIAGEHCVYKRIKLPDRSKLSKRTIPYQIEEKLCQPIETVQVAIGELDNQLLIPVITISKADLSEWLNSLDKAQIRPDIVTPDYMALSYEKNHTTILQDNNRTLCRSQDNSATLSSVTVQEWLSLTQDRIDSTQDINDCSTQNSTLDDIHHSCIPPLEKLAQDFSLKPCINLIQGEFEQHSAFKGWIVAMKLPAILVSLICFIHFGTVYLENRKLENQILQYDQRIEHVFRSAFPDTRRVVNARSQMKAKLTELKNTQSYVFLRLLDKAALPLSKFKDIHLQQLRYQAKDGALQIYVTAPSYSVLEKLSDQLQEASLKIQPGAFQQTEDSMISAQIMLWEKTND